MLIAKKINFAALFVVSFSLTGNLFAGGIFSMPKEEPIILSHDYLLACFNNALNNNFDHTSEEIFDLLVYIETNERPHDLACVALSYLIINKAISLKSDLAENIYNALLASKSTNHNVKYALDLYKKQAYLLN